MSAIIFSSISRTSVIIAFGSVYFTPQAHAAGLSFYSIHQPFSQQVFLLKPEAAYKHPDLFG
jgi:hypothetical protein